MSLRHPDVAGRPRGALFALIGLAVLVLAGCRVDVDVDVTMSEDGAGLVTVTATADPAVVREVAGGLEGLRFDDAAAAGWTVTGPTVAADGGAVVVLSKPFATPEQATAILAELNGPAGPFHDLVVTLDRSFARAASGLTGRARLDGGLAAFADRDLVEAAGGVPLAELVGDRPIDEVLGVTLTARLAGDVVGQAGGTVSADPAAVTWSPTLDGTSTPMAASFEWSDEGALSARRTERLALAGLVGWLALVLVVGTWWLARRQRRANR